MDNPIFLKMLLKILIAKFVKQTLSKKLHYIHESRNAKIIGISKLAYWETFDRHILSFSYTWLPTIWYGPHKTQLIARKRDRWRFSRTNWLSRQENGPNTNILAHTCMRIATDYIGKIAKIFSQKQYLRKNFFEKILQNYAQPQK